MVKVVLLGAASVGKSSLVLRLVKNLWYEMTMETIGASFAIYQMEDTRFEIWDTAGQERYAPISRLYYGNSNIIILVFDVTEKSSQLRINELITEVRQYNTTGHFIIVGNKMDLCNANLLAKWDHPLLTESEREIIYISVRNNLHMDRLKARMLECSQIMEHSSSPESIVTLEPVVSYGCSC